MQIWFCIFNLVYGNQNDQVFVAKSDRKKQETFQHVLLAKIV